MEAQDAGTGGSEGEKRCAVQLRSIDQSNALLAERSSLPHDDKGLLVLMAGECCSNPCLWNHFLSQEFEADAGFPMGR